MKTIAKYLVIILTIMSLVLPTKATYATSAQPVKSRLREVVLVVPPCEIEGSIDELNSNRWHDSGNGHSGALDLGYPDASSSGKKCKSEIAVASISGWVTITNTFPNPSGHGTVLINNRNTGVVVVIGHLQSINVSTGDYVSIGDPVGIIGVCGSPCPKYPNFRHIHFQVHFASYDKNNELTYDHKNELQYNEWKFSYNTPYIRNEAAALNGSMIYAPTSIEVRPSPDLKTAPTNTSGGSIGQIQEVSHVRTEIKKDKNGKVISWNYQVMFKVDWGDPMKIDGWVGETDVKIVPPIFKDLNQLDQFYYPIQSIKLAEIIGGYTDGTYRSGEIIYRDAMAKYITNSLDKAGVLKAKGYDSVQACGQNFKNIFPDVNENTGFHDEIWCIAGLGIVNGYSDGNYHPERQVLRDQMAKYIVNALDKAGVLEKLGYHSIQECAQNGRDFPDVDSNNKFHDEIKCIVALGIVSGYSDGTYHPFEPVTRGPIAKYIANGNNSLLAQAICYPTYPKTNCLDVQKQAQAEKLAPIVQKNNVSDMAFAGSTTQAAHIQTGLNVETLSLLQSGVWLASPHGVIYYNPDGDKLITYTVKNKLPHNKVNAIAQNPVTGEIWACTNLGAAKFDGYKWMPYTKSNGLAHNSCNDIAISSSGIVWIATNIGLSKFDGAWTNYIAKKYALPGNKFAAIETNDDGNVWGVVASKLGYFDGKTWHTIKKLPGGEVDAISFANGVLYLGHNQGILKYENNKFESIEPAFNVSGFATDHDRYLWVVSNRGGLGVYHSGEWVVPIP